MDDAAAATATGISRPEVLLKKRLVEADLLTAVVGLSSYAEDGLPEVLEGRLSEPPGAVLRRVMACVVPSDLSGGAQYLWARAAALHERGQRITWQRLEQSAPAESRTFAVWARTYGMGVPYQATRAAEQVAAFSVAKQRMDEARRTLADGIEAAEDAVAGVVRAL